MHTYNINSIQLFNYICICIYIYIYIYISIISIYISIQFCKHFVHFNRWVFLISDLKVRFYIRFYMNGSLFHSYKICHLSLCQGDIMYSSRMFTWLCLRREATVTKFSLLCKISKYVLKCRVLVLWGYPDLDL